MSENNKIDRYVIGKLSGEELRDFRQELANDKALWEEVKKRRKLVKSLEMMERQHLKDSLQTFERGNEKVTIEDKLPTSSNSKEHKKTKRRWQVILLFTILGVLAIAGYFFLTRPDSGESIKKNTPIALAKEAYRPLPIRELRGIVGRELTDDTSAIIYPATRAFVDRNYALVIKLLENPDTLQARTLAYRLKGHSYFQQGNYEEAAAAFDVITNDLVYGANADWDLLISLLAQHPAKQQVFDDQLAKLTGAAHPFKDKALRLERKLSDLE